MLNIKKENQTFERQNYFGLPRSLRLLAMTSAFTCLVKHFRLNPLTALLRSRMSRFSQTKFRNCISHSYAFTLAETLIALVILGIIAAVTIPTLIRNHVDNANRAKVKKAMAAYEKALNNMIIENDLKSSKDITNFGHETPNGVECGKTRPHFKSIEDGKVGNTANNSRFKTADGVWWDITDIENPIIMLDSNLKTETLENLQKLATKKTSFNKTVFGMVGHFEDDKGILRINDNAFEDKNGTKEQKKEIAKLYDFINKIGKFIETCTKADEDNYTCNGESYKKVSFTSDCITLLNGQESCPETIGDTVATVVAIEIDWYEAQNACPSGTHLATGAELKQMWDTVADETTNRRLLETTCIKCSSYSGYSYSSYYDLNFWAAEAMSPTSIHAIFFRTLGTGKFHYNSKTDTKRRLTVCVGD